MSYERAHSGVKWAESEKTQKVVSALADQMMDGFEGLPEDPNDVVVYDLMAREFGSRAEFPTWRSR